MNTPFDSLTARALAALGTIDDRLLRLIGGCLLIVAIAAVTTRSVVPQYRQFAAANNNAAIIETLSTQHIDVSAEIDATRSDIDRQTRRIRGELAGLPAARLEAFVIGKLQTASWRHDLEMHSIEPNPGERTNRYQETLFRLELEGSYRSILDWMEDLARDAAFLVVQEVQLTADTSDAADPLIRARLQLAAYRFEEA
ncbi:MAG: type 4a pilus biogenesis protein PilO [Pseudomonadota bacterium]